MKADNRGKTDYRGKAGDYWSLGDHGITGYGTQCRFAGVIGLPRFHYYYRDRGKTVARVVSGIRSALEMAKEEAQKWDRCRVVGGVGLSVCPLFIKGGRSALVLVDFR